MSTAVFSNTPSTAVTDNRGLTVRNLECHRHPDALDTTDMRITRHAFSACGFLSLSADPRLHETGLVNFTYQNDLIGRALRTVSTDADITVILNDVADRPLFAASNIRATDNGTVDKSQAVTRAWQYEADDMPGRPLAVTETTAEGSSRISERFVYAGNSEAEKALNLAGQCISHYDTAGLVQTESTALTGVPLAVTRRLLKAADNPDIVANWQNADSSSWNDLLSAEAYTTLTTADAIGAVLIITDALGHQHRVAYNVTGKLATSWLTVKGGAEQIIIRSLKYSATDQKLCETHGNGVVITYAYEPETQRLSAIKTERPASHTAGIKVLQALHYEYDPAGNVLRVRNDAEDIRFWHNQKVEPKNEYQYDSLYQLVRATGREMANASQQGCCPSPVTVPLPSDGSTYTNYTRTYSYDRAGNLTQMRHSAPATGNNYTSDITISNHSNRGVLSSLTQTPTEVDALFTAGGQQKALQPGLVLSWTARNELLKVTPVMSGRDNGESYRYDGGSRRVLKVSVQKTNAASTQKQQVVYLPGLELRTTTVGNTETESLQVLTAGKAGPGRAQVRILHWDSGKPTDISNDQIRYSYDDLTGNRGLEINDSGNIISMEEYYPYGGTAVLAARSQVEATYKTIRYSGKERDATGLYYYGYRYYQPWAGRWLSADPAGTIDGLNLFRMCSNNPVTLTDKDGCAPSRPVPKNIWHIWIGPNALSHEDIENLKRNAAKNPDYTTTILTDSTFWSADPWEEKLKQGGLGKIQVVDIMQTEEGKRFSTSSNYRQYNSAVNSGYAAAGSDILRYYWLKEKGGIYMDHDETVNRSFGDINLSDKGIGLSGLYRMPTTDAEQKNYGYSLSHFAVQPGSKILMKMLDSAARIFAKKNENYYESLEKGSDATTREILETSGNILFTKEINKSKRKLRSYYDTKLKLSDGKISEAKLYEVSNKISKFESDSLPLRGKITAGNAHTWMHNRRA